jgi:phosphoglycerol transferase MdoB-like AlkP superfamily enzyme
MKAISLFGVLACAHVLMLVGHSVPLSPWTPLVYFWQDVLVALLFGAFDHLSRYSKGTWALYAVLVAYAAINVPVARILSSPLTWNMMRAARGPLRDSILYYLTPENVGAIATVLIVALVLPWTLVKIKFRARLWIPIVASIFAVLGSIAAAHVETSGFHRNAYGALWPATISKKSSGGIVWRTSPFPTPAPPDAIAEYRGKAAGRNVVLIALESAAARYLRPYGAADDPTPNLTRVASKGIVFDRAYATYPESIKGLWAVLCSRYPAFQTVAEEYAKIQCAALPQLLVNAGYRTALFHSGRFMYLGMEAVIQNRGYEVLEDAGAIGGNVNSSFGVDEPATVNRILEWIDSLPKSQPFFLTYLPVAGHHPYATPEAGPFPPDTEFGNYLNALHYGDKSLGALLDGLHKRQLDEKTVFVFFGDHGEAFRQHDGNSGHSMFLYDENVRVPFIIAAPGLLSSQIRVSTTASLIDTMPTILDLVGLPIPQGLEGRSLLNSDNRMALFFTDYSLSLVGLYDSCWKYIYEIDSRHSRLYEVCHDPEELEEVSDSEAARVNAYRERLQRWIGAQMLR